MNMSVGVVLGEEGRDADRHRGDAQRHAAGHHRRAPPRGRRGASAGQKVDCSVVNAGDGAHEHPTQALLDALTIRRNKGRIAGLTVAICGDILHSRVARSNMLLLDALGARVRLVAPSTLLPPGIERLGVEVFTDMREGLEGADIVMMLRLQRERMNGSFVPSVQGIFPLLRPRPGQARLRQARRAGDASGADESRRRDQLGGRRRRRNR